MGTQNKLTEAYLPEKTARKEKVVIGLSGGTDSLVAAYLLKIQKYDLMAVTIAPGWEEISKDTGSLLSCSVNEKTIEKLQTFTHQMGIPHFVVRIPREFRDRIVEKWIAKKAQGELPDQCWDCHSLRLEYLHAKMKELGGKFLATGHYGKVFRNDADGMSIVQTSNDEVYDQSALLSRLPQEVLHDLLLPLSDLQKKEVMKLAENFGVETSPDKIKMFSCFPKTEETTNYLVSKLPERFRKEGGIYSPTDDRLGDHTGVVHHQRGENLIQVGEQKSLVFSDYVVREKKIIVQMPSWFERSHLMLRNCRIPPETPWHSPFRGILMKEGKSYEGWFYPKSLLSCEVELDAPASFLEGETISVMKKKGKNARVLLTGEVNYISEAAEKGEANAKVDYGRDF